MRSKFGEGMFRVTAELTVWSAQQACGKADGRVDMCSRRWTDGEITNS